MAVLVESDLGSGYRNQFVMPAGGEIRDFAVLYPDNGIFDVMAMPAAPEIRHLVYVIIEEEPRGGAGQPLASRAEEQARALGALSLSLMVELDNEPALRLYQAAGQVGARRLSGASSE